MGAECSWRGVLGEHRLCTAVIWSTRSVLTVFEMDIKSHTGERLKWVSGWGWGWYSWRVAIAVTVMGLRMRIINLDYSLSQLI